MEFAQRGQVPQTMLTTRQERRLAHQRLIRLRRLSQAGGQIHRMPVPVVSVPHGRSGVGAHAHGKQIRATAELADRARR